jgi:NhaP-type Na+/H+ and K+/H+ antiporter
MFKSVARIVSSIAPLISQFFVKKAVTAIGCAFLVIFVFLGFVTDSSCKKFVKFEEYEACYKMHNDTLLDVLEEVKL